MSLFVPDPTFYPSPKMAMRAPPERIAFVALLNSHLRGRPDELVVVDVDAGSTSFGKVVGGVVMPEAGDELHHFGWNACSACLSPYAPHAHQERRYLIVPGIRSSRIHVIDTKPDPTRPKVVKVISPESLAERAGYSRPHTVHCGPYGIYVSALGSADGGGPGGIAMLDSDNFEVLGRWEIERGPQYLAYDFWWHLGFDTLVTSEWGTPNMFEAGLDPEKLLGAQYGHRIHIWDLVRRRHLQTLDAGAHNQLMFELRPAHDPTRPYGFVNTVLSLKDLSSSIWTWQRENGSWSFHKVIDIPAEPADPASLPPIFKSFRAAPPLVTDINLSLDDRFLYVSCFGTGELLQYDVSEPRKPRKTGSVRVGGIVQRTPHPHAPGKRLNGGPQMVEVSRDGRRVYFTNSLYSTIDDQFYPDGIKSWMVKLDAKPEGGISIDPRFFVEFDELRAHQVRLEGGDASSDSYCYP
jgi:selenium-binding protein 1